MILPGLPLAGMEVVVARLTRRLIARDHRVGITCIECIGSLGEQLQSEGVPVFLAPSPGLRTNIYPAALVRRLRQRQPDVVHIHSGAWPKGARAAALAQVPRVIHTEHGLLDREPTYAPYLKRWAARYTAVIAAVSKPLLSYLRDVDGLPSAKLHLVPNGVDSSVFRPGEPRGELRSRFGLSANRVVIGHVARFSPVKNHALLLDAFALTHYRHPEAFLALIGDGSLRPEIEQRIAVLGLQSHVGLWGLADDLAPLYRDFDVFVLSSIAEGTSMSILEAMASGLPVVATDVGGNSDLIGDSGVLVPTQDAAALSAALEHLILSPDDRMALGRAARLRVENQYSESGMADRYEWFYRHMDANQDWNVSSPCVE